MLLKKFTEKRHDSAVARLGCRWWCACHCKDGCAWGVGGGQDGKGKVNLFQRKLKNAVSVSLFVWPSVCAY